jgi:hypothetical protein
MTQEKQEKNGKFNEWCLKYKPSIETIGIFGGIVILLLTAISVTISLKSLKISIK